MKAYLVCSADCRGKDHFSELQTMAKSEKAKNRDRSKPANILVSHYNNTKKNNNNNYYNNLEMAYFRAASLNGNDWYHLPEFYFVQHPLTS